MLIHTLVDIVDILRNPRKAWRRYKIERETERERDEADRQLYARQSEAIYHLLTRMPEAHQALVRDLTPAQILDGMEAVELFLCEEMYHENVPESSIGVDGTLLIGSQSFSRHNVLSEIAKFTGMWKDGIEGSPPDHKTNLLLDWILKALVAEPDLFDHLILDRREADRFVFIERPVHERNNDHLTRWTR